MPTTSFVDQEKIAPTIAKLFREMGAEFSFTKEDLSTLQSAIDATVHFYFYLTEHLPASVEPFDDATDRVIDETVAFAEYFWKVRKGNRVLLREKQKDFRWEPIASPQELRGKFLVSYQKLTEQTTTGDERLYQLMVLGQLQLMFLAMVFA